MPSWPACRNGRARCRHDAVRSDAPPWPSCAGSAVLLCAGSAALLWAGRRKACPPEETPHHVHPALDPDSARPRAGVGALRPQRPKLRAHSRPGLAHLRRVVARAQDAIVALLTQHGLPQRYRGDTPGVRRAILCDGFTIINCPEPWVREKPGGGAVRGVALVHQSCAGWALTGVAKSRACTGGGKLARRGAVRRLATAPRRGPRCRRART